jgi:hypothetical protein
LVKKWINVQFYEPTYYTFSKDRKTANSMKLAAFFN